MQGNNRVAKYDLTVSIHEESGHAGGLQFSWEYNTDLFTEEKITGLAKHFTVLLEGLLLPENQEKPLSQIPLIIGEERRRIVEDWNATAQAYDQTRCVHELFEACVMANPESSQLRRTR